MERLCQLTVPGYSQEINEEPYLLRRQRRCGRQRRDGNLLRIEWRIRVQRDPLRSCQGIPNRLSGQDPLCRIVEEPFDGGWTNGGQRVFDRIQERGSRFLTYGLNMR